jgi:hypothetical protein
MSFAKDISNETYCLYSVHFFLIPKLPQKTGVTGKKYFTWMVMDVIPKANTKGCDKECRLMANAI